LFNVPITADDGLALEAVMLGRCWIAILVNNILGQADINVVNSIGMGMMTESTSKLLVHC
jgi:hypothetical protein